MPVSELLSIVPSTSHKLPFKTFVSVERSGLGVYQGNIQKWNLGRPRFGSKVREDDEVSMTLTDLERNVLIQRLATFRVAFRIGKGNGLDHDSQSLGWHAKIMVESIHPVWTNQRVTKERCGPLVT